MARRSSRFWAWFRTRHRKARALALDAGVATDSGFDDKDERRGPFICGRGEPDVGLGDGFALVQQVRHCSAADALALVRRGYAICSGGETPAGAPGE